MKIVIFGLTITSSWGNGHATLWRGLLRAMIRRGWEVVFFEHDTPYYAQNRDLRELAGADIRLYTDWSEVRSLAEREMREADVGLVSSYCPDAGVAGEVVLSAPRATKVFYDLDTPVTLGRLERGEMVAYVGPRGFRDFDLVLSYTGGPALDLLREVTGAKRAVPLYGHVDPDAYAPSAGDAAFRGDLSYIGTYAADRQRALDALFLEPARRRPERRFVLAGAQYPSDFAWSSNVYFVRHLAPPQHPAFYGSSRLTLNVTRRDMAVMGWCPSGRLFEAASSAACMISDAWAGLDTFFKPGEELIIAESSDDTLAALELTDTELRRIGEKARARVLAEHTSDRRAAQLETILSSARTSNASVNAMLEA